MEEGETATFTVSREGDNLDALTVDYSISSGGGPANLSAEQAGEGDYTSNIPTSYEFPAGGTTSHGFTITAVDGDLYEPNEYFTVTVSGTYEDGDSSADFSEKVVVRIRENDERYLTLSPVSNSALVAHPEFMAKEGGIENGKNELKISLNKPLPYELQIPYTVGFSPHTTAATSDDFTMDSGTAKIKEDETSVTIDVGIVDDSLVEPTEYFTLQFLDPIYDDNHGFAGTYNSVNFQDERVAGATPLSVSIMDNDTTSTGGVVHLRGEGGGGIAGFPSTRKTLTEGQSTTITAEIAGAAPTSNIRIPLKVIGFPSDEVTSADYSIPNSITIRSGQKSGSVTLTIKDDKDDERYRELLVVEIDGGSLPGGYTKGDRSKYEVVMLDNDKTPASLTGPALTALTEARGSGTHTATFQLRIDRRPKAAATGMAPFADAETEEGSAKLSLGYAGTATRNTDYNSPNEVNIPSSGALPSGCSLDGEAVNCTVTLTVTDDNLYEGGPSTTESVKIDLNAGGSSFNDGIKRAPGYESLNLTIEDDDLQPMLSVGDATAIEGGKLAFEVKRTGAMENRLSVRAATATDNRDGANPATANSDYATRSRMLEFGKNKPKQTFEVTTIQDVIDEPNETFLVMLSDAKDTGGEPKPGIARGTATGTITDDDDAPMELTISVDTDTDTNGDQNTIDEAAGDTPVRVTATIKSSTRFSTEQTVMVTVGKQGDGAVEGKDYEEVADTIAIIIPPGGDSGTREFTLTPVNDRIDDDDEKISVEGALGDMTVTHADITIKDDDTRGITVTPTTLTIDEADDPSTSPAEEHKGTYEVALTSQPEGGTVTVDITNPGPTVATADPSSLTFDADNWETAQTVTMIAKDDTIDDTGDQKTTTITHSVSADGTDYKDETAAPVAVTVRDDDEAPMALTLTVDTGTDGDQDTISEGAGTATVRITATLDGATQFADDQTITITVGDSEKDTATEGSGGDYATVDEFNITLPAKAASVSHDLTLTLRDDDVDEPDETVTVAGKLAGVAVTDTMFTIEDNDDTPTVTLVLTPASINESGATNASTVTATMDGESSEAVTLTVSATPDSPAVAGDFTLSENKTLTIPANTQASTGDVTIAAVDNDVDAANKTVTVAATATGGNTLVQAPDDQPLTITDDDTRGITVSKATLTLDEVDNAATMDADEHQDTYTVVLDSEPSGGTVTIGVASGDTNIAEVAPATLTFTASNWDEPQTVTVTAVADGIDNPSDRRAVAITHTVTATETDYEDATASGVTVTVNDDDGAPTLSINDPSVTEELDDGATAMLTFTVQLLPQSGNTVTVDYADTGDGTATSGGTGDYATLASGMLTFAPGETSKSVAVTVRGDDIDEPDETVVVRLSSPSNATLTGGATTLDGTGTITDNDPTPTVSVADATAVTEGNVAAPDPPNNMTFTVTLSAASGLDVTVPYTLSGTATAGTDYTEPDPRSVTIAAGQTEADIEIPVAGDEVDEENETITVTLGTPTNATVSTAEGAGAASGTITDDDARGVSVTPTALTVAEADNTSTAATREDQGTYEVKLTSQPTGAVTVNLKSGDESVARIDTASLVFDADDWNMAQTVTVTGQADVIDNTGDEREVDISHTVSADGTDYEDEDVEGVTVTVTDDDAAPNGITLTASPDSVTENGGAKTITVTAAVNGATRYAAARTVSVSVGGGTAVSGTDYTAVESFDITIGAGEDDATNTFTLTPENDVLAEGNETIDVTGTLSGITITPDEITLTDDDAAPSGITLTVDTNGAEDGTPSTVGEDAGATVVTVTATVNGTTRYVDAKTVMVSVADGTAESPADYAAVGNFNITIAAGTASHTGSFTVTPVDDDLDEANETINVTGTLSSVTITGATVTFTDNDDPVSFSIADAEAMEGGKVTFTVSREGAGDNVATVKVATATDSGDGVNAADADDYTAIATAQTLNFAKGVTSQTVDVQTTQDDLFEPDETFLVNLSAPALADGDPGTGISIETGKGTATGTIKNDDTQPSFAVADASATEGDGITFTVTRSGAMDNAVSVKWNTKPDTGADAASATDYTPVTTATTLSFAKDVGTQTFTVATTEDVLDEENETFLVELTGAEGGTISTAEATGTINDDDDAPGGITLSVDTNGSTSGTPNTVAEDAGATVVTVTATVNGTTRYVDAKTVAVSVADGTAESPADYAAVSGFNITIAAGAASHTGSFTVTPVDDDLDEADETIDVAGMLTDITITGAMVTFTDNDDPVSFSIADAEATEGGKVTFTVSRAGAGDNVASVKVATEADSGDDVNAAGTDDYTAIATAQTLNFAAGDTIQTVEVQTTQDDLFEPDETFKAVLSAPALGDRDPGTGVSIESGKGRATGTIRNDDTEPSFAVADASASEGDGITFTVTRSGAMDNAVSVKWNTKEDSSDGANAASATDYTAVTAARTLTFAKGEGAQTFTVATTEDVLDEENETFLVELTGAVGGTIATAEATGTINDDDAAPGGITLSVDTNGSTSGTPNTVAEDAGATVVTVTATVNGTTRYVDARTVAVSVADGTAVSPADYAAVSGFNITIAAGAASQSGSFTVTPVDDDLDEANETINVTGTLSSVTITGATVTFTDNDDPVSFSIADAEATEGGKVTFTVSRAGAEDNVASVKVTTATDSGDGADAADADDYTAIATAQTLNFAKDVTIQTVEVQTTQDDLFEPDETFKAVLSAPALGDGDPGTGVSIETGKGTATGTIKNDDTRPSFAVADASASEGDAITFTVTRSGAMDNAVSVKWNTKADSSDGANAASTSDYTPVPTAQTLTFAKGESSQNFTVSTTEDTLHEGNETFLVELTEPVGGTISTAEATGTINDDDAAPTGITLTVSPATVGEEDGETEITVTATVNGTTRYVDAQTVTVSVGGGTTISGTDYGAVANFDITIAAGDASKTGTFDLTPTDDDLHEGSETIDVTGTSDALTITKASITLEDDDTRPSFAVTDASATEGDVITFTVTRSGAMDNEVSVKWNTRADSGAGAASTTDYAAMTTATKLDFAKGEGTQTFTVSTTEDTLNEVNETFLVELTEPVGAIISDAEATGTINDDDAAPTTLTLALAVDADNDTENVQSSLAENGGAKTVKVTATLGGSTQFDVDKTLTLIVGDDDDSATEGTDYTDVADVTLTIPAGDQDVEHTFTLTPTDDAFNEASETISFDATITGVTVSGASITLTSEDAAPAITLTVDADKDTDNIQTSLAEDGGVKTVRVTATLDGTTRLEEAADLTLAVGKDGDSAVEGTDYSTVADRTITIGAGVASVTDDFTLTPTNDNLYEGSETISLDGTLTGVTVTDTSLTLTDDDTQPSFAVADASASEGDAITFTVTRSGAMDNVVSVKWNTKAATGAGAAATSDYTEMTTATKLDFAKGVGTQTFTVSTTEDVLHEGNETFLVELTEAVGATIATAQATGTINDDDDAPGGITLSVDTNGSTTGTPSTVAEDAGATVVTVTATVNGTTRYVEAKTVAVSVADGTAASPADYAAVSNFSITIAAGAASHTGSFTVTPVDDNLDESNETIDVTGTLTDITITAATVTLTDTDDPVSFSITDAEATEGGKVEFTVSRKGAGDNVASVKVTTATDSGDGVNAADADDYTAIATAQTVNFAKGITSQTVEVQTTQDDLFEPDETFKAVLSAPALGDGDPGTGVSIESGKGTAIGTIRNDDTQPSFAVADASASEGDAITFTVTRSGAMDNAVSVKWNTKVDSSDGANAASATDYTVVTAPTTLTFAKGVGTQTFTVATTEDVLDEENETFLVELTEPVGGTITTAEATGTITDDDAAPTGITLTVAPATVGEEDGETRITVTATVNGETRYVDAQTVTVSVGGGSAISGTDYGAVPNFDITIAAGGASETGTFDLTPTQDDLHEGSETINLDGTLTGVTVTDASLTLTDDDGQPSFAVADASASEGDAITFTVTRSGAMDNAVSVKWNTKADSSDGANAASATDYTPVTTATTLTFAKGVGTQTFMVATTEDTLNEANETFLVELTEPVGATITDAEATGTITNDDAAPTTLTLAVDADNATENVQSSLAENGGAKTVKVTATLGGSTQFDVDKTLTLIVGDDDDSATEGTDYTDVADVTLTIPAGDQDVEHTFTLTPTDDAFNEASETISFDATITGVTVSGASITLTSEDAAPAITLTVDADKDTDNVQTSLAEDGGVKTVRVTATLDGTTRLEEAADLTLAVGKDGDSAVEGTDYTNVADRTITIGAGVASVTHDFTLTPTNDDIDEPDEGISIEGTLTGITVAGTSLTITDDEGTPTVTLALDPTTIDESGDDNASTVTAILSGKSSVAVTLTVAAAPGADTAAGDFTLSGTTLTIAAGATTSTGTVTITAVDNDIDAPNKTVTVSATASGGGVANPGNQTLTITDDEGVPTVTLALDPTTIDESGDDNASTVTAMLSGKSNEAVTLTVVAAAGADTAAGDFTLSGTTLTIAAGATTSTGTVTITAVDNDIDAPNKTVTVSATASGGGVANPGNQTLTITDDEGVPTVTLALDPTTIDESGDDNASTVTAILSGKSSVAVTLTVAAAPGADTAAGDFTLSGTTLTIAAGATTSTGTVTITAVDNDIDAPNKTVTVSATASGGGVANPGNQTLTITDDEGVPTVTLALDPTTIDESGDDNASTVTAMLSGKSNEAVTLTVVAAAGADTAAGDFTLSGTTLTIAAGATTSTGTVTITAVDNDIDAPNKTVTVSATASGGGVANPGNQTLTITDDEGVPTVTLALDPTTIDESGDDNASTVTAMLSGKSNEAVTLTVAAAPGADTAAGDFTLSGTTLTIAAGATTSTGTVTITAVDNDIDAPNKTVTVSATASGGGVANPGNQTLTITDDEGVPTVTLALDPTTINESGNGNASAVTAMLSGKSNEAVTLTVVAAAGADTAAGDFTLSGTTLTIAAGATTSTGTVTITAVDNDIDAPNKTVTVSATASGGGVANPGNQTLTITDDEGVPTVTLALDPTTIDESGDGNASAVTAMLSGKSNEAVTLTVVAAAGADTAAGDFTLSGTTLTIAAGATTSTGTVTITAVDNDIDAPNKTVTVSATASGGGVANPGNQTLTITDDEGVPTVTLALDPTTIDESGDGNASAVTAMLSGKSNEAVTLTVVAAAGADTAAGDFTLSGTTLTIAAGATTSTGTVTITAVDNDIDAPNKTVTVSATASGGGVANPGNQTLTITDDEGVPTVTLALTPTTINESGNGNASTVTATLSGKSSAAVTVEVSVPNNAPVTLSGNTTLTIAAGSKTSTGTVTITAVDNDVDAPNASVVVSGAASGGSVANPDNQTLTITDDEGTPTATLVLTPTTINESGGTNASTVTATLSGKSNTAVTLTVAAAAGANTAAADFTLSGTTLTIAVGATTSTGAVTITAVDNDIDAPNKTVTVSATASGGGVSNPTDQTLTITDDEGVPTVTLALDPTTINESGNGNASAVTAMLSGKSNEAVTLTVVAAAGADTAAGDFTLSGTTLTIAAGATTSTGTVTITAVDNDIDAPNKTVTVSATASGGGVANPGNQTLTITDDEGVPTVTLALDPTTIDESGDDNASTVTAILSGKSSVAVTLTVAAAPGADTAAGDFTLSGTTLTIAAGATTSTGAVTITAVDNDVDAPNKTVTVSATASGGGVSDPTDQTLTITDDEGTPTVTLVLTPTTINESGNGNASTVTATLSGESSAAVTVEVSVPNNAPVTLSGNTTLTIAAGSKASTGTVTITAVDNDVDAPNASVVVSGVAAGGGVAVANPGNQTLTITDDEGTPTVTLVLTPTAINESGNGNASTVTATLSGKSNTAVTLTVVAAAGANTAAGDFTLSGTTLTIAAGATTSTGTVKITAVNNNVDASNKSVTVSATASGGGVTNPDNQTLTINDDDAAPTGITLSVSPATLGEGDGLTQITVTAAVNGTTRYVDAKTVTVSVGGGTAISGTDYGAVSNFDITIAAGDASETGTFDLTPTDDALHEEDETINVTGSSGALTITPAAVTITDNDNAGPVGTVSLSTSRYEVLEGDSLSVTVNLSEAPAADTMIELEATSPGGYSATPGADYVGGVQTVTIRAGTTSGKARISTTRDNQNDPNETFKLAIRASELPGTVTLGEPDTAVVTIREPVSGITPPETATVVYAGRHSRILMPVPAGLKGHGIDVAFYFDWGPGTAQGGGDCREPGTDVVDWGHWPSYPEGMVRTGPLVRIAEDINTDTIELEIELCKGSVGKTFTASWDSLQWLGNPDRGFPGVKSYPFNAAAAHCTSTALCYTRVTIIGDTPDPDPEITIAAGGDITEGGDAVFTVQASPAPASDLEIALAIADDAVSDFLADGEEGSKTVTIAAGSDTATYTLATTDDDLEEANGGVSATLEAGTGYRVGSPSTATVAVADNDGDDDARATVVRITGGADITEGGVARFTLTGAPAPSQDITVNLRVTQSGAFAGDGELGARPVTLGTDATVTVDIPTVNDSTLEDDGSLTVIVEPGTGYTPHATDATATVAVADNEVPSLPTIHIDDVEAAEGDDLHFTFTLSHAVDHEVVVYWETRFGANYHNASNGHGPSYGEAVPHADFRYADSRVTVYPGSTRGEFWVETFDDFHDEGRETLTVVLTEAEGAIIADELAIGTIVNSDPMPAAWLARFGRAVAEQALDGIAGRIAAPRTAGMQGMIAGQALSFGGSTGVGAASPHGSLSGTSLSERARLSLSDIDRLFGDERATDRSRTLSGRDLLLGSRFTLTGERDATGGNLAFWGRAAQSGFDGREGRFSLDGEAMTAMLGADYARDQWLAGMALMRSSGKGGGSYADPGSESGAGSGTGAQHCLDDDGGMDVDNPCSGAGRGAGGKVEATLTAAIPYLALQASERVKLWGALGHGVGEVMLKPELGEMLKSDISWSMASLGLRGDLLPTRESPGSESGAGGPALALISDALWAGTSSEKTRGLAASDSDVTRLRLGLEGSWKAPLEGDASITPKLEMGMRHDGGDAETGFGVELGGGIAWMDPRLGLSLDLSGRALVAHDAGDLENRGFATSLAFDPDPASERGLSFALRQDWGGQAEGGLDALFQADPLSERTGSGSTSGSRWSAEGAYGFPALSGRFISSPHIGLGLATGARDYSLGWRLTPARNAPDISFRLKATRRESDGAAPEHTVGFEISARW